MRNPDDRRISSPEDGSDSPAPASPGTVFSVNEVPVASRAMPETGPRSAIEGLAGGPVESCSDYRGTLVACRFHPLVQATWAAFNDHRPLVLSPDVIWLTIAQGLAIHINQHAERLRHLFVTHSGKQPLQVRRDDFVKGSPENSWGEVIDDFSRQIGEQAGPKHELIVANFSTTGAVERVASEVVLMDAMQSYFEFECYSMCGIPTVTLEGTVGDWEEIRSRLDGFSDLDLSWWTDVLRPILDQFVSAASGTPDRAFWRSIFKVKGESGGPYLSGWLLRLFPYLQSMEYEPAPRYRRTGRWINPRNSFLAEERDDAPFEGVTSEQLPGSLSRAPFVWDYLGQRLQYEFIAGMIGIKQDHRTMGLMPKIGWAVRAV
jgi:Domain of unknown function (DUF4419)